MNFVEIEMMTDSKDLKYHLLQIKNNVDGVKPKYFQLEMSPKCRKIAKNVGQNSAF